VASVGGAVWGGVTSQEQPAVLHGLAHQTAELQTSPAKILPVLIVAP
jgi:hypothetical protein